MQRATLVLEDGTRFVGAAWGALGEAAGEVAVTTQIVGNVELLTSPLCRGKILVNTFPTVGGYGVIPEDFFTQEVHAAAMIVHEACAHPSNYRSSGDLDGFLRERGIPGLCGIDTRALMLRLRGAGAVRAALVPGGAEDLSPILRKLREMPPPTLPEARRLELAGAGPHIAVADFGCGLALGRALRARGARVSVLPPEEAMALSCDAIALSDGPEECLSDIVPALPDKPFYGEGLGHLLVARERGAYIAHLPSMHGGANLPVRWGERVYITRQFHALAVEAAPDGAIRVYENLNDRSVEGIVYEGGLTVQFAPGLDPGPHDMGFLYDQFIDLAKEGAHAAG